jgi:methylmalonyl-CoA mutase cobalamin-binding subunit
MITVAQEHYGTSITRRIMERINTKEFNYDSDSPVFLGVCAPNDNHEVGLRMICDFLESDGWKTIFIGSSTTISSVIDILNNYKVDVLGISISLSIYLNDARELINQARKSFPDIKILVGGNAIKGDDKLVKKLGADDTALDANDFVRDFFSFETDLISTISWAINSTAFVILVIEDAIFSVVALCSSEAAVNDSIISCTELTSCIISSNIFPTSYEY